MKNKFNLADCLQWRHVANGFVCYKCEVKYKGKQKGLAFNGKTACIPCAEKKGVYTIKTTIPQVA